LPPERAHKCACGSATIALLQIRIQLHLDDPELVARGIDAFSRDARPLAEGLQLPAFEPGQRPLYPPPFNPAVFMPPVPFNPRYSAQWHEAAEEEQRAIPAAENLHKSGLPCCNRGSIGPFF
jgi:hypothetical protein